MEQNHECSTTRCYRYPHPIKRQPGRHHRSPPSFFVLFRKQKRDQNVDRKLRCWRVLRSLSSATAPRITPHGQQKPPLFTSRYPLPPAHTPAPSRNNSCSYPWLTLLLSMWMGTCTTAHMLRGRWTRFRGPPLQRSHLRLLL